MRELPLINSFRKLPALDDGRSVSCFSGRTFLIADAKNGLYRCIEYDDSTRRFTRTLGEYSFIISLTLNCSSLEIAVLIFISLVYDSLLYLLIYVNI